MKVNAASLFCALCRQYGLPEPKAEYRFHPLRRWKFDWCWPELFLALEQEGGIYGRGKKCPACGRRPVGAHSSIANMKRDIEKYREAAILGYLVIRCLPDEIADGSIFPVLKRAVEARQL